MIFGAVATVVGIVLFLWVGSPQGGTSKPDATAWWSAALATVVVVGLLAGFARHSAGGLRIARIGRDAGRNDAGPRITASTLSPGDAAVTVHL